MHNSGDDRTMLAKALGLAYAVMSASIEMIAPVAFGYWLDRRYQTSPVLTLAGVALGLGAGLWALVQIVKPQETHRKRPDSQPPSSER